MTRCASSFRLGFSFTLGFALAAIAATWPSRVLAAEPSSAASFPEVGLILASGESPALNRGTSPVASTKTAGAWRRFLEHAGATWRGSFDEIDGIPRRIWGAGILAPGVMRSADVAAAHARAMLDRHIDLFAPGARPEDFELSSNALDGTMRTLGFVQRHGGVPVFGGQVSFRYRNDRLFMIGSEALPDVEIPIARRVPVISDPTAERAALSWIQRELGADSIKVEGVRGVLILPIRVDDRRTRYQRVIDVRVRTSRPAGLYAVYLDAVTAEPVARRQLLMFSNATLSFNVPERWPGGARHDRAASGLAVTVDGSLATTDEQGMLAWTSTQATSVLLGVSGTRVQVVNQVLGAVASKSAILLPDDHFVWNEATHEYADAQLTTYIASSDMKAYVRRITPRLAWLDAPLIANVNIGDYCNAFSDGETINFFQAGGGCENTGRLPDVVAHEAGHTIHFHAIIEGVGNFDSSLSEGASDYLAATMQNDPAMGRGFFFSDRPLRDLDPAEIERRWPDHISRDPHETGLILGGALWDLRKNLIKTMGRETGIAHTDAIWYALLQRASDLPSAYAEAIAYDDDDGDLANGTPHLCDVNTAFSPHGLVDKVTAGPGIEAPQLDQANRQISFSAQPHDTCVGSRIASARIRWHVRDDPNELGVVDFTESEASAAARVYTAALPRLEGRGKVISYRIEITFDDDSGMYFPENPADPMYEISIGDSIPLYCTGFEADPLVEGWTHALEASTATGQQIPVDDWEWGPPPPSLPNSRDPTTPFAGDTVIGNDLGMGTRGDGRYQSNTTTTLTSPSIDAQGHASVHVQFRRWLTVEDGLNDAAIIYGNGHPLWRNLTSERASDPLRQVLIPHLDKEWRFQDVDLSSVIEDGRVQVKFELTANRRRTYGGWTLDDFCVVAFPENKSTPDEPNPSPRETIEPAATDTEAENIPLDSDPPTTIATTDCGCSTSGRYVRGSGAPLEALWVLMALLVVAKRIRSRSVT